MPGDLTKIFPSLLNLNINGNEIADSEFEDLVQALHTIPNLESLYINLHQEDQVDLVMRVLTNLKYLNGLPVEHDMLEDEEGEEEQDEVQRVEDGDSPEQQSSEEINDLTNSPEEIHMSEGGPAG